MTVYVQEKETCITSVQELINQCFNRIHLMYSFLFLYLSLYYVTGVQRKQVLQIIYTHLFIHISPSFLLSEVNTFGCRAEYCLLFFFAQFRHKLAILLTFSTLAFAEFLRTDPLIIWSRSVRHGFPLSCTALFSSIILLYFLR